MKSFSNKIQVFVIVFFVAMLSVFICSCSEEPNKNSNITNPELQELTPDPNPTPINEDTNESVKTGWFTFTKQKEYTEPFGELGGYHIFGQLVDMIATIYDEAAFWGRCKALFGEAAEESNNYENMFSYYIYASDGKDEIPLEIYFGPGGPSVACGDEKKDILAAKELAKLILNTDPIDYEYVCGYEDAGIRLVMGVKDGEPYEETLVPGATMDMSEKKREKMAKEYFKKLSKQ